MSTTAPTTDKPYAICRDCDETFPTKGDEDAHLIATFEGSTERRSHTISIINPTPAELAHRHVRNIVDDAITRCMDDLDSAVRSGRISDTDVRESLQRGWPDFLDAWDDYCAEDDR